MAKDRIHIEMQGDIEMKRFLSSLPMNFQKSFQTKVLRKASKPGVNAVKGDTNVGPTGNLKRSIGFKMVRGSGPTVFTGIIGARMGRRHGKGGKGFHANLYAHGTKRGVRGVGDWIVRNAKRVEGVMQALLMSDHSKQLDQSIRAYTRRVRFRL